MGLVDQHGNLLSRQDFKKAPPPKMGEAFGDRWQIGDNVWYRLPAGGLVQFDLNKLTIEDFRAMKDHYQINASLSVLTFMMHQLEWEIECDNAKIKKLVTDNMVEIWTRLVRALSQAWWCGYSPCILQWENDIEGKRVVLTKVKDLRPEMCEVNWKLVEGWAPPGQVKPKIPIYDGIKQYGLGWPIPPENTLWYPLLMENGNYYGRKLLRSAFTPWYFSLLVHMFANRYMERYGEPLPIGRAPYENVTNPDGTKTTGMAIMGSIMSNLRNRSVVVLPDDRSTVGNDTEYDYQIEYLESQMRGADFERYLIRLDEEISLSLFTPLLILRTADVGSYNLGSTHWNMYQQMLNSLAGDWAEYINRYVIAPLVRFNASIKAPQAKIVFRKLGDEKLQTALTLIQALISGGLAKPDLDELGSIAGLTLTEIKEVTAPDDPEQDPNEDPNADPQSEDPKAGDPKASKGASKKPSANRAAVEGVRVKISERVSGQIRNASGKEIFAPDLGFRKQLEEALGESASTVEIAKAYGTLTGWLIEAHGAGIDNLDTRFDALLRKTLVEIGNAA